MASQLIREYTIEKGPFSGTYGSVAVGRHQTLVDVLRAIKQLHPHVKPDIIVEEARKQAEVKSPYVVQIYDFFHDEHAIVMEYCPFGLDDYLMDRLKQTDRKIPYDEEARELLHGVLQGLSDAHSAGVIHGDIKPANVRFGAGATEKERGLPKLSDFGAARRARENVPGIRGSTNWMAPEVIGGGDSTEASDYFSYGVLAYLVLTGQHPYFANDPSCLTNEEDNIVSGTFLPQPIGLYRSDIPQTVCTLVMDLLSRDRETRLKAAKELKAALSSPIEPAPHIPSYAPQPPSPLSIEQLDRLNQAYKDAKDLFFRYFQPGDALRTIEEALSGIELDDVRGTRTSLLADLLLASGIHQ